MAIKHNIIVQNIIQLQLIIIINIIPYYSNIKFKFQIIRYTMQEKAKYNPHRIPYNAALPTEHRMATSSGKPTSDEQRCSCCLLPIMQSPLPINFSPHDLLHLGIQYKYLYSFTKLLALILLLLLLDSGISQFQDAILSEAKQSKIFGNNWTLIAPNYSSAKFLIYSLTSFVMLLALVFLLRIYISYKISSEHKTVGQQWWSVLIKNIPRSSNVQDKIRDLFKANFDNLRVRQVIFIPIMQSYNKAQQQINAEVQKWKILLKNQQKEKQTIFEVLKKIQLATQKLEDIRKQLGKHKSDNFSGNAIVIFESRQNQQQVLKAWKAKFFTKNKFEASFGQINLNDKQIIIAEQAPSPTQIDWNNISLPNSEVKASSKLNYILMFIVFATIYLFYFISQLCIGRKIGKTYPYGTQMVITLVLLELFSYVTIPLLVGFIQKRQKQISMTNQYKQLISKYSVSFMWSKTLAIFAVQSTFDSYRSYLGYEAINKIVIVLFIDFALTFVIWLINPWDLVKRVNRLISLRRSKVTQIQAIYLEERPSHMIPFKYSFILCTFWTATTLLNVAPISIIIALVSLFCFYWLDKLNLAKRSSVSNKRLSQQLVTQFVSLVDLSVILKPLANLILISIAHKSVDIPELIMPILGLAYCLAPKDYLVAKIFQLYKYEPKKVDYAYDERQMETLYQLECPIYGGLQQKMNFIAKSKAYKSRTQSQITEPIHLNNQDEQPVIQANMQKKNNSKLNEQVEPHPVETERNMVGSV